jgi:hypothetical protein
MALAWTLLAGLTVMGPAAVLLVKRGSRWLRRRRIIRQRLAGVMGGSR